MPDNAVVEGVKNSVAQALGALAKHVSGIEANFKDTVVITLEVRDHTNTRHVVKTAIALNALKDFPEPIGAFEVQKLGTPGRKKAS